MKAEIINIGDELLIGQVVNTNASWMAEQLSLAGIDVVRITTISDNEGDILQSLKDASERANAVLISGGLGPTRDDITKDTLCHYFGSKLVFHEASYRETEKRFLARGMPLGKIDRQQAMIPDNCTPIPNNNGTALGMWFEKDNIIYVSMPGVPFEMKPMITDYVLPELKKRMDGFVVKYKTILTQGIGESYLAKKISHWEDNLPGNIKLAYLPQPGMVRLRVSCSGPDDKSVTNTLEEKVNELRSLIPDLIFGYDDDTMEEVIGKLLREKNYSLSTAESCTGGYIAHLITSIPGSSDYFTGSVVAYSNEIKMKVLGVDESTLIAKGAVSEQTVKEMANGVKKKFKTDFSIAVSGVAGPDGGTEEKPVGTVWIALAGPEATMAKKFLFFKNRERNIRISALAALNMLRIQLLNSR